MRTIEGRLPFSALAIAVAGLCAADVRAQQLSPPLNDDLANAVEVAGTEFQLDADLGTATRESFEPYSPFHCGHTAWWTWTAPAAGIYQWDSTASSNTVAVAVYRQDNLEDWTPIGSTYLRPAYGMLVPETTGSFQAQAGVRYLIQLDLTRILYFGALFDLNSWCRVTPRGVSVAFRKSDLVAPLNDNFADRVTLTGSNALFSADLSAATGEADEPRVTGAALKRTLWWSWESPGYGSARIRKIGPNAAPVVGIYSGGELASLQLLASSATEFTNTCYRDARAHDSIDWDTVPGGRYEIQVDRFPWFAATAPADLELVFSPAPANDEPAGALPLTGLETSLIVSNTAATRRPGEVAIPTQSGSNSVWFRWTAPARGIVQVTRFAPVRYTDPAYQPTQDAGSDAGYEEWNAVTGMCSPDLVDMHPPPPFVPVFGLFDGSPAQPGESGGPGTILSYGTDGLIAEVPAADDYWIELDGDQNTSGVTPMNLLLTPPPANDDFENRVVLPTESVRVNGRTFAATRQPADPAYLENNTSLDRSVWWEWRAPAAGRWTLFVVRGRGENKFVVYRGAAATTGSEAGSTEYQPVIFDGQAGETFQIGAFALGGLGGNIEFTLTEVAAPVPRLLSVRDEWWGERWVHLQLPDNSGLSYVVDRSDDLSAWTPVVTNANFASHFLDIQSDPGKAGEFFRTRLQDGPGP
jgi:hypothetical protein